MSTRINRFVARFFVIAVTLGLAPSVTYMFAQDLPHGDHMSANRLALAQVVALDECDPKTFNEALGPGFCKNISLGYFTTLSELISEAQSGHPDPNWDFEPDAVHINKGTTLSVVDQGGEPHTFTEVKQFGGGFIPQLNGPGEQTIPECSGGFGKVPVARTRLLQGSQLQVTGLAPGEHLFQCCIHPWMHVKVEVK